MNAEILADILAETFVPAVQAAARDQSKTVSPGGGGVTYVDATRQSNITLHAVDDEPGSRGEGVGPLKGRMC